MTVPTQAQIAAAHEAYQKAKTQHRDPIAAALTAAAEVEPVEWHRRKTVAATIERCAQVVDGMAEFFEGEEGALSAHCALELRKAAAEIRALKDEGLPTAEDVRGILKP